MQPEVEFFEEDHRYEVDREPWISVTGITSYLMGNPYSHVSMDRLENAKLRGQRVHAAVDLVDEDDLDWDDLRENWPKDIPYIESYVAWKEKYGYIPIANEQIVVNRQLRYCGRMDKKGILFKRKAIIEIKTVAIVSTEDKKRFGMQTVGYAMADGEVDADRYVLQIRPGKEARLFPFRDPRDFVVWKQLVSLYHWMTEGT